MKPIDTHCHLDFPDYKEDFETIIKKIENELLLAITIAASIDSNAQAIAIAEKYPFIYAAIGLHPHDAHHYQKSLLEYLEKNIHHPKVVAIGEIGLDYYKNYSPVIEQKKVFEELAHLASLYDKPVIVHSREAILDTLEVLKNKKIKKAVFHCFTGDWEEAQKILQAGYFISFSGIITFNKNLSLEETAKKISLDRFFIETDAPFLAPAPFRGKRNEPVWVKKVAEKIAQLRNTSLEEIITQTNQNAKQFFGIK